MRASAGEGRLLGAPVHAVDMAGTVDACERMIQRGTCGFVCAANVHVITESVFAPRLRTALEAATLVVPDGMPLVWWLRRHGSPRQRRVYGPDLTLRLLRRAHERRWRIALFGGTPMALAALSALVRRRFRRVRLVAAESPPFKPSFTAADLVAHARVLNRARPALVLVGLGAPKQELWMAAIRARLRAPVLVGVGAAFDFLTGAKPQAPRWMMRSGLEWAYRLATEPRRLWKRYLLLNPVFLALVALQESGIVNWSRGRRS